MTNKTLEITLLNDKLNMEDVLEAMENENVKYPEYEIQVGTYDDFVNEWMEYLSTEGYGNLWMVPTYHLTKYISEEDEDLLEDYKSMEHEGAEGIEELIGDNMKDLVEELAAIYELGHDLNNVDGQANEIEINGETYYWMYR